MAMSAWRMRSSASSPEPAPAAGDADRRAHPGRLAGDASRPRRAARRCGARPPRRGARRRPRAGRRTRRRRAARRGRSGRTQRRIRSAAAMSTASPAACPAWSLMRLKSSRSRKSTVAVPLRRRERLVHAAHEQRAVGEVGERVAVGLALERALQLAHAADRLLQAVELERHAGVAGERLEQAQVGRAERAGGADAVAEQHHADQPRLARHRRDRPARAGRARPCTSRARRAPRARPTTAACSSGRQARSASASSCGTRLHRLRRARGVERRAQREVAGRAEQDDLGAAHAERLARALEQVDERGLDVGRAAERARDAVEELERLVLGVLGQVRAVGEHEHRGGRDDQPAGGPVLGDQRRAGERRCSCW